MGQAEPTWPRARLQSSKKHPDWVVLILEWKPHSGLDAFTPAPDGRVPSSELRTVFKRYRQGVADILLPSYSSNPLSEMCYFHPDRCCCVYYEMGRSKERCSPDVSEPGDFLNHCKAWPRDTQCFGLHVHSESHGYGCNDRSIGMSRDSPNGMCGSICLVTTYRRNILFCNKKDSKTINPTHVWFHAMDPDTYPYDNSKSILPLSKDKSCMN